MLASSCWAWEAELDSPQAPRAALQIQDMLLLQNEPHKRAKRATPSYPIHRWSNHEIPYSLLRADATTRKVILLAMAEIERQIDVKFVLRDSQRDYLDIRTETSNPAACGASHVGAVGMGAQPLWIAPDCRDQTTALHELIHALGFHHSQSHYWSSERYLDITQSHLSPRDVAVLRTVYPVRIDHQRVQHDPAGGVRRSAARRLRSALNGQCLQAQPLRIPSVRAAPCRRSQAQYWRHETNGSLSSSAYPQRCLGVEHWAGAANARVDLLSCSGAAQLRWQQRGRQLLNKADARAALSLSSSHAPMAFPASAAAVWQEWFWDR